MFLSFWIQTEKWILLGLKITGFKVGTYSISISISGSQVFKLGLELYILGSPGSPVGLHHYMSNNSNLTHSLSPPLSLYIHTYTYIHIVLIGFVSSKTQQ